MDIRGRSGAGLRETWEDEDARAYLGMTVPDYPNLLILYGPNAQGGHGGSLIGTAEMQTNYLASLLRQMQRWAEAEKASTEALGIVVNEKVNGETYH